MGSLFIKNFKREPITDKVHFLNAVVYTHRNPIHHGFCSSFSEWEYCSYNEIVQNLGNIAEVKKMLQITDGLESFIAVHYTNLKNFKRMDDV